MSAVLIEKRSENKRLIDHLESTLVPETGLELFTVGEKFRSLVSTLENEIISLSSSPQFKEYIIEAPFGGGKTHLLRYLTNIVTVHNGSKSTIISSMDMSRLSSPDDFELKVIRGMRSSNNQGYGEVLRTSYDRIIKRLGDEYLRSNIRIDSNDLSKIFETLLYFILGRMSTGILSKSVMELLGDLNPVKSIVNYFTGKTVMALATQARTNSNTASIRFVDAYMAIVKDRSAPLSRFDEACVALAKEKELCNVIFRMLHLADYKSILILVDELETVKKFDAQIQKQVLTSIRDFRDRFSLIGEDQGYPSAALIVASTSEFSSSDLEGLDPALQSRWKRKKHPLLPLNESDVDHLIFRLRDVFYQAGYSLKPIDDGDIHEIITLRREIFNDVKIDDRYPRDIIAEVIKRMKKNWVTGSKF